LLAGPDLIDDHAVLDQGEGPRAPMSFIERNEDVFKLSGQVVVCSSNLRLVERRNSNDCPVLLEVDLISPTSTRGAVEIEWGKVSEARKNRGDLIDFTLTLEREKAAEAGDLLVLRFPFRPQVINDPDFAITGAASFQSYGAGIIVGTEVGFGSERGLEAAMRFSNIAKAHLTTAWKFAAQPQQPYLELRFHLNASEAPLRVRVGKVFVGYEYDPYLFNPEYEYRAYLRGKPSFPGGAEVLAEFERQARVACQTHQYQGSQAFTKPYLVMREGARSFPMLIGTPNSMSWYGSDPLHHIDEFEDEGWVRAGEVSLDCGAHAGQMATLFGLIGGKSGKVIAFDPFPQNYLQVEAQGRLNGLENLVSTRAGVGETNSTLTLSILGQMTTETRHTVNRDDKIELKIVPLDEYADARPTFVKLDIEGAEVQALRGSQNLMARFKPRILTELHTQLLRDFGHSPKDFFDEIPQTLYRVYYKLDGIDSTWREYQDGDHERITAPGLVLAEPR
jgi:FkbM family methyltransferase